MNQIPELVPPACDTFVVVVVGGGVGGGGGWCLYLFIYL